jgi:hypothetical protein
MFMVKGREISAEDLSKNINGLSEVGKGCIGGSRMGGLEASNLSRDDDGYCICESYIVLYSFFWSLC